MFEVRGLLSVYLGMALLLFVAGVNPACASKPISAPSSPSSPSSSAPLSPAALIRIQFLGQSCFLITSGTGLKIMTDPYTTNERIAYSAIEETADIVTVSHEHSDHNNVAAVKGQPEVVKGAGVKNVKGIQFRGIATWHDDAKGTQRGPNTVICFLVDGARFCHLGDLGHRLNPEQVADIGQVDVLFIPVGGLFTIDAKTAIDVCNDLKPKVIIPMHYKTPKGTLSLASVDDFLQGRENVKRMHTSIFEFKLAELSHTPQIIVLETAK